MPIDAYRIAVYLNTNITIGTGMVVGYSSWKGISIVRHAVV